MKILILTSDYHTGGYGQFSEETCRYLVRGGHDIQVLTSVGETHDSSQVDVDLKPILQRNLDQTSRRPIFLQFFIGRTRRINANLRLLKHALIEFAPDVVFIWQGTGLDKSLLLAAETSSIPTVYRLCDYGVGVPEEIGLVFKAEDAAAPAAQLKRLTDLTLRRRLSTCAQSTVSNMFDIDRTTDQLEQYLLQVMAH